MTSQNRKPIPAAVKREVRRRCYFGCVKCGNPIIEYHHMTPWNLVNKHKAENLTLLCSDCHTKVTRHLISEREVTYCNEHPFNKDREYWPGLMLGYTIYDKGEIDKLSIEISDSQFRLTSVTGSSNYYVMMPIVIDGMPLISFSIKDGRLNLFLKLFDENNNVVVEIRDNELVTRLSLWDITFEGNTLKVNRKSRDIFIEIDFNVPYSIHIKKGYLFYNQRGFEVKSKSLNLLESRSTFSNNTFVNCPIGISLGKVVKGVSTAIAIN